MISSDDKKKCISLIEEAFQAGARLKRACEEVGIAVRSYFRWKSGKYDDTRKGATKEVPRKLSPQEVEKFYDVANEKRFRDMTPVQIVPILLEEGVYYGSERTLYRILKDKKALACRTESRKPVPHAKPEELVATGPNQVWAWDITWLKTDVKGMFWYAYVVIDIFSRKIVGWAVHDSESSDLAKDLFDRIIRDNRVNPQFVHADNGGPMKGVSLVAFLTSLNVGLSYSRPRVSDDNPQIESFFKTLKYNVKYPKMFTSISAAREWFAAFIDWYNTKHRHSGIGFVTPHQKHTGQDIPLFAKRQETLEAAILAHPERFVNGLRRVMPERTVRLHKVS